MNGHDLPVDKAHLHVEWVEPKSPSSVTEPPVLILHGGPGADSRYLRPQLDAVADLGVGRRIYFYDQRGADRSPQAEREEPPSVAVHVSDVDAVRRSMGVEKVRLIGYSWGALLAMLYAVKHPQRVERLVLLSPAPPSTAIRLEYQRRMAEAMGRPEVKALRDELQQRKDSLSPEELRRWRFALAVTPYFVVPRRALELTPFLVKQRLEEAIWKSLGPSFDLRAELATLVHIPSLVIHGEEDVIPIESAVETAALLSAELVRLPSCGHVPYIEAPGPLFAALTRFLA